MTSRRYATAMVVTLSLAAVIHTDWHFARPVHHRLSLGLSWHWVMAIPGEGGGLFERAFKESPREFWHWVVAGASYLGVPPQ